MGSSRTALIILVILTTYATDHIWSERIYVSENPVPVGHNVTLFTQTPITTGIWLFNNNILVSLLPNLQIWRSRVLFNATTSSLTITSLELNDSGIYTLQQLGSNAFTSRLNLSVQAPISDVSVNANATNLVEFNDTVVFTCSVSSGTAPSYVWLNGSSVVIPGDGIQLSDGDSKLTIVSVTRYDVDPFKCNVSNAISNAISMPISLNINYGPNNTTITLTPMDSIYRAGSNILLSCSVESHPPAVIQWMFNGGNVFHTGSQLHLERINMSNAGSYKCLCHNTVTARFSSTSANITVMEPVSNVTLRTNQTRLVEFKGSIVASCSVLSGSSLSFLWLKGDSEVTADERLHLTDGNSTLTIANVSRYDQGPLRCRAFNAVSNITSDAVNFTVSYGPENMNLTGGGSFAAGSNVSMLCLTDSSPPAQLKWAFRGELLNTTGPELNLYNISEDHSGAYTCQAFNTETSRSENITTQVIITKPSSSSSGQAASLWLLHLLSLAGLLFTVPH